LTVDAAHRAIMRLGARVVKRQSVGAAHRQRPVA
jgi:hypothetical protein